MSIIKKEEDTFLLEIKGKKTMFYWALQYGRVLKFCNQEV